MKFTPLNEAAYRRRLARNFLEEAGESFLRRDYRQAVESSQLAAENAAKAVIAYCRVPSWSYDPSNELLELLPERPAYLRKDVERIAEIVHRLAPEHGRVTYGEPTKRVTPWELYNESDAKRALTLPRNLLSSWREF